MLKGEEGRKRGRGKKIEDDKNKMRGNRKIFHSIDIVLPNFVNIFPFFF